MKPMRRCDYNPVFSNPGMSAMRLLRDLATPSLFAVALAMAGTAFAQTTTAPAVPTMTPTPGCEKPGDPPSTAAGSELGKGAAEKKRNDWTKNMKAYLECIRGFAADQQAAAAPHIRAANAAIEEFNRSVKILNDQIEAANTQ
jgi:hypothetical protein